MQTFSTFRASEGRACKSRKACINSSEKTRAYSIWTFPTWASVKKKSKEYARAAASAELS